MLRYVEHSFLVWYGLRYSIDSDSYQRNPHLRFTQTTRQFAHFLGVPSFSLTHWNETINGRVYLTLGTMLYLRYSMVMYGSDLRLFDFPEEEQEELSHETRLRRDALIELLTNSIRDLEAAEFISSAIRNCPFQLATGTLEYQGLFPYLGSLSLDELEESVLYAPPVAVLAAQMETVSIAQAENILTRCIQRYAPDRRPLHVTFTESEQRRPNAPVEPFSYTLAESIPTSSQLHAILNDLDRSTRPATTNSEIVTDDADEPIAEFPEATPILDNRDSIRSLALRYEGCIGRYQNQWVQVLQFKSSNNRDDAENIEIEYLTLMLSITAGQTRCVQFNWNEWTFPLPIYGFVRFEKKVLYLQYQPSRYYTGLSTRTIRITNILTGAEEDRTALLFNPSFLDCICTPSRLSIEQAYRTRYKVNVLTPEILLVKTKQGGRIYFNSEHVADLHRENNTFSINTLANYDKYKALILEGVFRA